MVSVYDKEKELASEVSLLVERSLPGVDVLAVELVSATRFCVYVDHPDGVDHALCERVTDLLRGYLDRYTVEVSSPGPERPLRRPDHFARALGRSVAVRKSTPSTGASSFRGRVVAAREEDSVALATEATKSTFPTTRSCGPI